jgi:cell division protein FtsI (penicillin-binding protein 3)
VRLSLDLGVQHALHSELRDARRRYAASAAAGIILDVRSGEVLAASSLPDFDPHRPATAQAPEVFNRLTGGTFELGSIFKVFTAALALEQGATLATTYDTTTPLVEAGRTIRDHHAAPWPLTLQEIFVRSSNVGAARIALSAGGKRLRALLARIGATGALSTEAGTVAAVQFPETWKRVHTMTAAYGHGIAVAPLQFAVAAASLVNGGRELQPTFLAVKPDMPKPVYAAVVKPRTSKLITKLMRLNVTSRRGTGRAAAAKGYRVGGKTGTAELASAGGYRKNAVISSFVATFPTDAPRYLSLVVIFEPQRTKATRGRITASVTAAPVTGRLIARIAPLLNVLPR